MNADDLRRMVAYDEWANARVLEAVTRLGEEEQDRDLGGSFPTLRALAAHVVGAEWLWLRRWRGENPAGPPEWLGERPAALQLRLARVQAERRELLATLQDGEVDRRVEYRLLNGTPGARTLAELVLHAVNHSTYHRGQMVDRLRRLGAEPPSTDLLEFTGLTE